MVQNQSLQGIHCNEYTRSTLLHASRKDERGDNIMPETMHFLCQDCRRFVEWAGYWGAKWNADGKMLYGVAVRNKDVETRPVASLALYLFEFTDYICLYIT